MRAALNVSALVLILSGTTMAQELDALLYRNMEYRFAGKTVQILIGFGPGG